MNSLMKEVDYIANAMVEIIGGMLLAVVLFVTFPVWAIPYAINKYKKQRRSL